MPVTMIDMLKSARLSLGQCAQLACLMEVMARKAGNVHPGASFDDVSLIDFVASAVAIGPIMERAFEKGVGQTVLACVTRCRELVPSNTNLGMLLLLAPLAAALDHHPLRAGVEGVLSRLSVADAQDVYAAIRLARPGGLGMVHEQDVANEPTLDLRSAMRLAEERDLVARQYANGFQDVFDTGVPALNRARQAGMNWEQAIIYCHLVFMSQLPDSLIARKLGPLEAKEAACRAAEVLVAGWPTAPQSARLFDELDRWLRELGNQRNPGTTADLVTASLFASLRDGTIEGFSVKR